MAPHKAAKRLLVEWLRETSAAVGWDGHAEFGGFSWRVNRSGPSFGIWEEYPILFGGDGTETVCDEIDDKWIAAPPTYDDVVALGSRPACILDIAVQHKGQITLAVEVRHKHACDDRKVHFLRRLGIGLIEIPTLWVLGQVERPVEVPREFWLL